MRPYRHVPRPIAAGLAILVAGCATDEGAPGDGADPGPSPAPGEAAIELDTRSAPPGGQVRIEGSGFPAGASVDVGIGVPRSEYDVVETVTADPQGRVSTTVTLPSWVETDRRYVFVLAAPGNDPRVVSETFHVTQASGRVRVEGEITGEGVECPALQSIDGTLYTLAGGDTEALQPGDRVVVEGRVAEMSICMQGITLDVTSVERR